MANTAVEKGTNVNVAPALSFKSEVATVTNACVESTRQMLEDRGVKFDEYSKQCVISAMGSIYSLIHNQGLTPNDINPANLQSALITVAALKLNANAVPRECYFQIRSVNTAKRGEKDKWNLGLKETETMHLCQNLAVESRRFIRTGL